MDISQLWTFLIKMLLGFSLLLLLHITEGCRLEGHRDTQPITAYTGDSVLLPCSCTDLHTKPETFTWRKYTNKWVEISPESDQYKDRFQLDNDHSSGNLSLLISHLTVEDGGDYMCDLKDGQDRYIRLTVKGCTLNHQRETVTGHVGQSVLLPCSCSELQAKPHTFTWTFYKGSKYEEIFPKDQKNYYTNRVQLFNDHLPGNLSLLISHLTVEDGGWYKCRISDSIYTDVRLTVEEAIKRPSGSRPKTKTTWEHEVISTKPSLEVSDEPDPLSGPSGKTTPVNTNIIIPSAVVGALLLLLILGGLVYWKRRGQKQGQTETGDGQTGQRTQQKQEFTEPLNLTITPEPTYDVVHDQNDPEVPYAAINPQTRHKKAEEKDDVTYSTVVHSETVTGANTPMASTDSTVYATIKSN